MGGGGAQAKNSQATNANSTNARQERYKINFIAPEIDAQNLACLAFYREHYFAFWAGEPSLYRLFVHDIFSDLDCALFLGGDVIALQCVSKIFTYRADLMAQNQFAVASENFAIHIDSNFRADDMMSNFCKHFHRKYYFDPDMMLLNLGAMRAANMTQKIYEYARAALDSPHKNLINAEEGLQHLAFEDNVRIIPHAFNFTLPIRDEKGRENVSDIPTRDILRIEARRAVFVHYACLKPWYVNFARRDTRYYWHYRNLSPFKMRAREKCAFLLKRRAFFIKQFLREVPILGEILHKIYRPFKTLIRG